MKIKKNEKVKEITDYDYQETTKFIDKKKSFKLQNLGLSLPKDPPSQVISIRLPRDMYNELKAFSSKRDVSYQSVIKLMLSDGLAALRRRYAM